MFTDWTQTDPHYFYLRGAIMGCVLTLFMVMPIINELRKRLRRTDNVTALPPQRSGGRQQQIVGASESKGE